MSTDKDAALAQEARINAGIRRDPDNPAWTAEDFRAARPAAAFFDAATMAQLATLKRPRGRPAAEQPKILTPLRLDADIVAAFKRGGKGWQTRMNAALRAAMPADSEDGT